MRNDDELMLYVKKKGNAFIIVCLYVYDSIYSSSSISLVDEFNDSIYSSSSISLVDEFMYQMMNESELSDMGLFHYFLGLEVYELED